MSKKEHDKNEREYHSEYLLHKILEKLEWMEWNYNPPVNYPLIVIISAVTSLITAFVFTRL